VNQATPVITWSNPATITYGTALSATQLNATASVPGTLTYTPASGAILSVGTQTLNVNFVPTDTIDYTSASDSVSIQVLAGLALSSILPTSANYGSAATTITLTGTGFSTNSIVQLNGTTITSSFVSSTQMTAVIPATFLQQTQPGAITVTNPATQSTTAAVTFTVLLPNIQIVFTGPSTESPGQQPSLSLQFLQGYPLPLQVTLTLSVAPATAGGAVDPSGCDQGADHRSRHHQRYPRAQRQHTYRDRAGLFQPAGYDQCRIQFHCGRRLNPGYSATDSRCRHGLLGMVFAGYLHSIRKRIHIHTKIRCERRCFVHWKRRRDTDQFRRHIELCERKLG
jgi:hypothetical protein